MTKINNLWSFSGVGGTKKMLKLFSRKIKLIALILEKFSIMKNNKMSMFQILGR